MNLHRIVLNGAGAGIALGLLAHVASAQNVSVTVATVPPGLAVNVDGTDYSAPAIFSWTSSSAHTLIAASPQLSGDSRTRYSFSSWSDAGLQTNQIVTPGEDTTYTATFALEYLLDTAVTPAGAGTITNSPPGPWYAPNQLVSLTAVTNSGFRFFSWAGVDTCTSNTAQVTMTAYRNVSATLIPADFPFFTITNNSGAAPGALVGALPGRNVLDRTTNYYVILDNSGTNFLFYSKTQTISRFVAPNGLIAKSDNTISGWRFKDETFASVDSFSVKEGYTLDSHDVKLFPNGHCLLFGQEFRNIDMSKIVPNGRPDATVTGDVVQELDANNKVVFEWHTLDYIDITNSFFDLSQKSIDYAHMNALALDPIDNNLLLSLRTTSEIVKVDRRTGAVIWRLGGKRNMFTFIGEHPENAPYYTVGQHDIHRLANGNLLYFDNGNISGGGITPSDRTYSRAVEYQIDEVNMTATLVWEFRHTPDISAPCTGSVRRFANGNTLINWGCAINKGVVITEVSPAGAVVFEVTQPAGNGSADGFTKQVWNSTDLVHSTSFDGVVSGQTYASPDAGVSVTLNSLSGPSGNELVVQRHLDAVRFPQFTGTAPQVLVEHVTLSSSNIDALEAQLQLALPNNGYVYDTPLIHDPAQLVVYQRQVAGQGTFSPLTTTYNSGSQTLTVTTTQTGEFILGYPDLAQATLAPAIVAPLDQATVNQEQPVVLDWSPRGIVGSYRLQVASDPGFNTLLLDSPGLTNSTYTLTNLSATTQYYWRVNTSNDAGASDWAAASFTTVAPMVLVTSPNGGEVWQRGFKYFIQWSDNLAENIIIDLYTNGTFMSSIRTNASVGAFQWTVGVNLPTRNDYSIRIRSATNSTIYDFSDAPFSILDAPKFGPGSVTPLPDGRVQLTLSVPGAAQATVLGSSNLVNWDVLQSVPLTGGIATWVDDSAVNYSNRFYRLRVP